MSFLLSDVFFLAKYIYMYNRKAYTECVFLAKARLCKLRSDWTEAVVCLFVCSNFPSVVGAAVLLIRVLFAIP